MPERKHMGKAWLLAAALGWVLFMLPYLVSLAQNGSAAIASFHDDSMRLVEVRDLIAGRGWFDHIQPRMGLGDGTFMHWSRLVDAPIAAIILLFTPILGQPGAEMVALVAWPLLLGFVPVAAAAFAAQALTGGARGAILAAILMAQMLILTTEFDPGSLDHHNAQVALLMTAVCLAAAGLSRPRVAAGAGVAAAASIAVGIEALPHLALLGAFVALWWAAQGVAARRTALNFFLGLAIAMAAIFAGTAPPESWAGGFCDALSIDQAAPILVAALGMAGAAAWLSGRGRGLRFVALAAVGGVALVQAAWLTPACLSNPVDTLDPYLRQVWFDQVAEVQPLFKAIAIAPMNLVPMIAVWCIGMLATLAMIGHGRDRAAWAIFGLMLLAAMGMSLWQMRGVLFIGALAVVPVIGVVERLYARAEASGRPLLRVAALGLFFVSVPHFWAFGALAFETWRRGPVPESLFTAQLSRCFEPEQYAGLAALPPGLVAVGSNLGGFVLLTTPHRVLSAPYHRNQDGMIAQFRIDYATDAEAERMLRDLKVDYVVACADNIEFTVDDGSEPGFSFRLNSGKVPGFLVPEPAPPGDGVVRVYRLAPEAATNAG